MIKMQIVLEDEKIANEKQLDAAKVHQAVDDYLTDKLELQKTDDGFYLGDGAGKDFSRFGLAFNALRKKDWFLENVKTWLYFNSDASNDPDDFVIEDFKDYCQNHMMVIN